MRNGVTGNTTLATPATVASPADPTDVNTTTTVVAITINYGRADLTHQCLQHVLTLYPQVVMIVVDNASPDGSGVGLHAEWGHHPRVSVVLSPVNTGFSGGTNLGITAAKAYNPQFIWLLNNDAVPNAQTLPALLAHSRTLQQANGITGSVVETEGKPLYAGGRVLWAQGKTHGVSPKNLAPKHVAPKNVTAKSILLGQPAAASAQHFSQHSAQHMVPAQPMHVDYVTAASMLIPWSVIQALGPWDERYFLYVEDIEYCLRARQKGFSVQVAETSRVHHPKGQSTGGTANPVNRYYAARNRLLLFSTYGKGLKGLLARLSFEKTLLLTWIKSALPGKKRLAYQQTARLLRLAWWDYTRQQWGKCHHTF
jgi:GT2 family glycosyltransferase